MAALGNNVTAGSRPSRSSVPPDPALPLAGGPLTALAPGFHPFSITLDGVYGVLFTDFAVQGELLSIRAGRQSGALGSAGYAADGGASDLDHMLTGTATLLGGGGGFLTAAGGGDVLHISLFDDEITRSLNTHPTDVQDMAFSGEDLYWTDPVAGSLLKAPATTLATGHIPPGSDGSGNFSHLAISRGSVYWTAPLEGTVLKTPLTGGATTTLVAGQRYPLAIAADGHDIYWTDYLAGTVSHLSE